MIKILIKVDIEGAQFIIRKAIYDKATANIILDGEKLKDFILISGTRKRCPLLPLPFKIILEILVTAISKENEIKTDPNWKVRSKTVTVCTCHDALYRKSENLHTET